MASIESLIKQVDKIEGDRGYFTIGEIVDAISSSKNGESAFEVLQREHPSKTFDPSMVQSVLHKDK